MDVNGQHHTQAALPLGKEPQYTLDSRLGWAQSPIWMLWRKE
jgi:hypothetical protein